MADNVNVANWPNQSSRERVTLDLMKFIRNEESTLAKIAYPTKDEILDLYEECRLAVIGRRK